MFEFTTTEQALLLAGTFLFFTLLEGIIPLLRMKYQKARHTGINLMFILTSVIVSIPFAFVAVHSSQLVNGLQIGVLNMIKMPDWLYFLAGLMLLDFLTSYLPHLVQHKVKWMWKFHLVHHTDTWVDTSTANRHHPGETVISMLFLIVAIFITGAPAWLVILHQVIAVAFSQFTHANISLPLKVDEIISWVFISPNTHKVHHHHTQPLTGVPDAEIAERLRQCIEDLQVPAANDAPAPVVTGSVATATAVPQRESAWEELDLIKAARHALREARASGGNRVLRANLGSAGPPELVRAIK